MKRLLHLILIFTFSVFLFLPNGQTKHIISGMMAYECLGNDDYKVTMILYRDCTCVDCAYYDDPAYFNIYKDATSYSSEEVAVELIEEVESSSFETCTGEFGTYCVDRGTYSFIVNLPRADVPYSIVYQRCCWAKSVGNMLNPEDTGISIMTEITPKAQEVCNTQNIYEDQMAFVACPATEVALTIPKFDAEGDSLTVEMCLPFLGAGPNYSTTSDDPDGCETVIPLGKCPPPYDEVPLLEGFNIENPFPTEDGIHLDPATNTIHFVPTTIGRYIFSLCFTEFRDGEILSQYRSTIQAQIQIMSTKNEEEYEPEEETEEETEDITPEIRIFAGYESIHITSTARFNDAKATLLDVNGRELKQLFIQNRARTTFSMAELASGIYIVLLKNDDEEIIVQKVYVE